MANLAALELEFQAGLELLDVLEPLVSQEHKVPLVHLAVEVQLVHLVPLEEVVQLAVLDFLELQEHLVDQDLLEPLDNQVGETSASK